MSDQPRRISFRLTPYQARQLWRLRTQWVPEGQPPRTATEIIILGINKLYNDAFPLNGGDTAERVIETTPNGPIER